MPDSMAPQQAPVAEPIATGNTTLRMPALYTVAVVSWMIPFVILAAALTLYYVGLFIMSIQGFMAAVNKGGETKDFYGPIIGILVGGFLAVILVRTLLTLQTPDGVRIEPGILSEVESLVKECAITAGVEMPNAVFVVPDVNAFAYSSGLRILGRAPTNYVSIGVPLLVHLGRSDLMAVLYHEFSHIILRRRLWSVTLSNKMEDFLLRFQAAQASVGGFALLVTYLPRQFVRLFYRALTRTMAYFSRREELLVDRIASTFMGTDNFRHSLVRAIAVIGALSIKGNGIVALKDLINADFYCSLLTSRDAETSQGRWTDNYFDFARSAPQSATPSWETRRATAFDFDINSKTTWKDTHPSLSDRILNLGGRPLHEWPFYSEDNPDLLRIGKDEECRVSKALLEKVRPVFFASRVAAGFGPLSGFAPGASIAFICKRAGCPRRGLNELWLSENGITAYTGDDIERIGWTDIKAVEVFTGSALNTFESIAAGFAAVLRGAPINRRLRVHLKDGTFVEIPHWHFMQDVPEVEVLISEFWKLKRASGALSKRSRETGAERKEVRAKGRRFLVFAMKATCALLAYVVAEALFFFLVMFWGPEKGLKWFTPFTIFSILIGAAGWRLGNRIALRLGDKRAVHKRQL